MTSVPPASNSAAVLRLLVQCPDRPGIVAAVSQFLFAHGANITQADQFSTSDGSGRFFLRIEFQAAVDLIFQGKETPNGLTEAGLIKKRREYKAAQATKGK